MHPLPNEPLYPKIKTFSTWPFPSEIHIVLVAKKCIPLPQLLDVAGGHKQEIIFRRKKCGRFLQWSSGCLLRGQNAHGKVKKRRVRLGVLQENHPKQQAPLAARVAVPKYPKCESGKVKKRESRGKVPVAATPKCS